MNTIDPKNKIIAQYTQDIGFNNKIYNVVIKSYEHPIQSTKFGGDVQIYARVDIYDGPDHWGHMNLVHTVETQKDADAFFNAIALYPERYKNPTSEININYENN